MHQKISLITLGVENLEKARAFYERLGWIRSVRDAEGVAFFQMGGMALSLFPREELAKDAMVEDKGANGFHGMALGYCARTKEHVDAILERAVNAGAKLVKEAQDTSWGGYSGYFSDPDNFLWEIAWNPGFQLQEDGTIKLPDL